MRRLSGGLTVLLWVVASAGLWAQAPTAPTITLQDAINTALSANNQIAQAQAAYRRSQAVVREVAANGLPQVRAEATQAWMGPVASATFQGPDGPQTITLGSPTSTTAAVTLSQILDLNGSVSLATDITRLQSRVQNLGLARTEQQIIFDVQNAYYNVLRAQGQRDVSQAAVTTARERLRIARAQLEAGTLPQFDVTRADVEVANLEQTLISATTNVDIQKSALLNVMGADPTKPIDLARVNVNAQPLATTVDDSFKTALTNRPEIRAAETGLLAARKTVSLHKRERLPLIAATASYNYNANTTTFQPNSTNWIVGVNASLPIFEGGAIRARVDEARADVDAAQSALDQTKLDVGQDVKTATLNLSDSYQRIQTAAKNVTEAEEALRLAQVRYQAGISLQVEVTDAETALTQARNNLVNATYDYATALARYQRATATQPEFETATAIPAATVQPVKETK